MPSSLGLFLRELARSPRNVSAPVPSSQRLAHAMVAGLGQATGPVAEFGPGTGIFTAALLNVGIAPDNLTLFELNPAFTTHLTRRFPGVRVINDGAQTLPLHCPNGVAAIISGLPLLSFPPDLCHAIYAGAVASLKPGGIIRQFTYGPNPPLPEPIRAALGLRVLPGPRIWLNLPPARVYTYSRA